MARRNVNDYEGRVPGAKGTGPRNLAKTASDAFSQVRAGKPKASRAGNARVRPSLANAGYGSPPRGGGGGIPKATTPMAGTPKRVINQPKTGRPRRGMGKPRADFPSKI